MFYEDINNILNIGEVPTLYKPDDKDSLIADLKLKFAKNPAKRNLGSLSVWEEFLKGCRQNLHLVLCVSPIGDSLRLRMRNFPSLINCSSIIWYLPWSDDSLRTIAKHNLLDKIDDQTKLLLQHKELEICNIFVKFHKAIEEISEKYYSKTAKRNYVTPINYKHLLENFLDLLNSKQTKLLNQRNQYIVGVQKLDECAIFVEETKIKLESLKPELDQKSKETMLTLKKVEIEKEGASKKQEIVA